MRLKILGTGTCIPSLQRCSSSYLLLTEKYKILVDVGPSVVRRLVEFGYTTNDIDIIILTHFHVDHTVDLSTFLFACNYDVEPRVKTLILIGGQGIYKFYKGLLNIYPWMLPKSYRLILKSIPKGKLKLENLLIETCRVNHNRESIGIRIEENGNITFTGDTDYSRNLVRLAQGTDLLVSECAFPERKVKGHLNLSVLGRMVSEAQPEKVIISHLYLEWEDFKGVLYTPYLIGEDGMEMDI
jgi:ribonuclease BN (tRNA processing enzyme)